MSRAGPLDTTRTITATRIVVTATNEDAGRGHRAALAPIGRTTITTQGMQPVSTPILMAPLPRRQGTLHMQEPHMMVWGRDKEARTETCRPGRRGINRLHRADRHRTRRRDITEGMATRIDPMVTRTDLMVTHIELMARRILRVAIRMAQGPPDTAMAIITRNTTDIGGMMNMAVVSTATAENTGVRGFQVPECT